MDLTENLMTFLEEQDEKDFVPQVPEDGVLTEEEIASRFKIRSKDQADYYVRKYKEIQLAEAEIEETAKRQIERLKSNIEEWKEKELNKLQYPKYFFTELLEDYATEQLAESKKKTLSLPNGSVGFKKQSTEYKYDDDLLVKHFTGTKYAHEEVKIKVNKTELKKAFSIVDGSVYIEGVLVPGVEAHERDPKFEIK